MNIKGIGSTRNVIDIYHNNKVNKTQKIDGVKQDSVEISGAAKALNSFSPVDDIIPRSEKVKALRQQVLNGTYKPDSTKVAKAMLDSISGGRV